MLFIIVGLLCSCLCLSRQHVCTDVNRFPQLNNNYTVVGLPLETITVGGMLGCVRECQMMATCKAFTYKKTRNCSMYAQFEFSSPNNVDVSDVTSIISDWNTVQNYTKYRVTVTPVLTPGQDCYIPGTEQLLQDGTVVKTRSFYNGTSNVTLSGRECQMWAAHNTHNHHGNGDDPTHFATGETMDEVANYCRVVLPDPEDIPWCYTTDPSKRWDNCTITECT
ncbi:plasminogen-like [Haliotis rufescens]|uniref:plasminogen-like n=1 Tax=Haliotis rufescens TaxID=6454 RepID=UPI00201FAA9A|nr:plasminogen-like [Haliotis rufescens]